MSENLLPEWQLKKIYFSAKDIHRVADNIAYVSDVANMFIGCLHFNDDYDKFRQCVKNGLDDLRHTRELYGGYPESEREEKNE